MVLVEATMLEPILPVRVQGEKCTAAAGETALTF